MYILLLLILTIEAQDVISLKINNPTIHDKIIATDSGALITTKQLTMQAKELLYQKNSLTAKKDILIKHNGLAYSCDTFTFDTNSCIGKMLNAKTVLASHILQARTLTIAEKMLQAEDASITTVTNFFIKSPTVLIRDNFIFLKEPQISFGLFTLKYPGSLTWPLKGLNIKFGLKSYNDIFVSFPLDSWIANWNLYINSRSWGVYTKQQKSVFSYITDMERHNIYWRYEHKIAGFLCKLLVDSPAKIKNHFIPKQYEKQFSCKCSYDGVQSLFWSELSYKKTIKPSLRYFIKPLNIGKMTFFNDLRINSSLLNSANFFLTHNFSICSFFTGLEYAIYYKKRLYYALYPHLRLSSKLSNFIATLAYKKEPPYNKACTKSGVMLTLFDLIHNLQIGYVAKNIFFKAHYSLPNQNVAYATSFDLAKKSFFFSLKYGLTLSENIALSLHLIKKNSISGVGRLFYRFNPTWHIATQAYLKGGKYRLAIALKSTLLDIYQLSCIWKYKNEKKYISILFDIVR